MLRGMAADLGGQDERVGDLAWLRSLEKRLADGTVEHDLTTTRQRTETILAQHQRYFEGLVSLEEALQATLRATQENTRFPT
jgi:hypothetical protein